MGKHKFVLTKHTKKNGKYYYTCMVLVETVRKPKDIFELFKYGVKRGVPDFRPYRLKAQGLSMSSYHKFDERADVLAAIDKYIQRKEEEDGENVVSTETDIIYR